MAMSKRLLSPDEETEEREQEPETEQQGLSLEDAILAFVRCDLRYQELSEEKKRALEILIPEAQSLKGATATTRLKTHDEGVVLKFEFGTDYKCDANKLNEVKDLIGEDLFERYFAVKIAPKMRELKPFLASKSTDERMETARQMIKEAITHLPRTPMITIEKGRGVVDDADVPW